MPRFPRTPVLRWSRVDTLYSLEILEGSIFHSSPSGILHISSQNNKPSQASKTGCVLERDDPKMKDEWLATYDSS